MIIKLQTKRDDVKGLNKVYKKGDVIDYVPYQDTWKGMEEKERVNKGIFVFCYGHEAFDVFTRDDVIPYFEERYFY